MLNYSVAELRIFIIFADNKQIYLNPLFAYNLFYWHFLGLNI